jgi:hypothetical protein
MSELRSTVRRLRSLESVVELPAGMEDLSALAEQARSNGLDVRIVESGDQRAVPDALGRVAYRIVHTAYAACGSEQQSWAVSSTSPALAAAREQW